MNRENLFFLYEKYYRKRRIYLIVLLLGLIATAFLLLGRGAAGTDMQTVAGALYKVVNQSAGKWTAEEKIILLIRAPRVFMAILTGAALSVAGTVMQSITRNPLVSPFTVGVSAAATFGASLFLLFGGYLVEVGRAGVMISAFAMAAICAAVIYGLAQRVGTGATTLILIGIGANYIFSAGTSVLQFFAEEYRLAMIVNWTFGSFNAITWTEIYWVTVPVLLTVLYLQTQAGRLNAVVSGDDDVLSTLGLQPEQLRKKVGLAAIFITALTICFTGIIGFVGLIGPHISRILVGSNHRYLVPYSAIVGAWLVLLADAVGSWILAPVVLPVGIVIAFLGVPLFMHLVMQQRTKNWD